MNSYNIVATDRITKKRVIISSGLTEEEAKGNCYKQPTYMRKLYKYFKAAKAK